MIKNLRLFFIFLLIGVSSKSQITENFSDGDFTANPVWSGNAADWIVNPALQLQSNNTVANSTFYLSTPNALATTAQWDFYVNITFNPSSANYIDVFLTASSGDLSLAATTGYFVRIGNTDDEISLYRKDGAAIVKIIDGVNGILNTSNNLMRIRVVRNSSNLWILSRDITGTGNSFVSEGTVTDATFLTSSFFGFLVKQSTSSFFQRHFFDDITVQDYVPDVTPPAVQSATATSSTTLDVLFNEPVELLSSQAAANYEVSGGIGFPSNAVRDAANPSLVHLSFANPFPNRTLLTITVNGVKDLSDNVLNNGTATFAFFTAIAYDIVIDELMADPSPVVGLPDNEWIELRNTSPFAINLQGWRLGKPSGESGPMPSLILQPDSFVIVVTSSAVPALTPFGRVISVTSFPSLSNSGDLIYLKSPQGLIIHAVQYTDDWYKNELKKNGGWSLEMIDTHNPCTGSSNWTASVDPSGGTPGRKNSVDAANPDVASPRLLRAFATDSVRVVLVFSEPLDSVRASQAGAYTISDGIGVPLSAFANGPLFTHVTLNLSMPLQRNRVYTVSASLVTDCAGNPVESPATAKVGLSEMLDSLDIVINEILFNPRPGSVDYIELYNRSGEIQSLKNAYLANRSTSGAIASITQLSPEDYLLFPGEFVVVTTDKQAVMREYVAQNPAAFLEISSMPSYSDDKGNVILLNEQGNIVDLVSYAEKWHFKLISNREGVSLERIAYDGPSNTAENWHSAATSVGFGTPTYKNSQFRPDEEVQGEITASPEVFSPDNDGLDDFLTIDYLFPEPGYVANITIFDAVGRPVRYLQRNALNGIRGNYRWDGLGEKNQKLPVGIYIIYTEIFNLQGKTKKFKNVVVLARKQ